MRAKHNTQYEKSVIVVRIIDTKSGYESGLGAPNKQSLKISTMDVG